jgi:hypothetical protein
MALPYLPERQLGNSGLLSSIRDTDQIEDTNREDLL